MSTKTTFKRIALVAVAALGLGVLSVAPSSATASNVALALVQNGTSTNSGEAYVSDSTTAAVVSVSALLDNVGDTLTVTFVEKSKPAGADATPYSYFLDTTTGRASSTIVDTASITTAAGSSMPKFLNAGTGTAGAAQAIGSTFRVVTASVGYVGAKFAVQLDSASARTISGDYVYTAVVKVYNQGTLSATTYTQDVTISVPKTAAAATTPSAIKSYAVLTATNADPGNVADAAVTSVATASSTAAAYVYVALRNANNSSAAIDSITATITGAGVLSVGGVTGSSFKIAATGDQTISILPDGRAGVATITIATSVNTYSPKTVTFYAKAAKTITASVAYPTLAVGANAGAVAVTAVDANGTNWTGQAYIVASSAADALVAGSATTPVKCAAYNTTDGILCPVTAIAPGTAKFKVIDAATVAAATATSNEVTVTVSQATANSVKLAFDKSTLAPNAAKAKPPRAKSLVTFTGSVTD